MRKSLNKIDLLSYFSSVHEVPSYRELVETIFVWIRCDWLGATWFVIALMGAIVFQKIILCICGNKVGILWGILSSLFYLLVYVWRDSGVSPITIHNISMYAFVQFYFGLGLLLSVISENYKEKGKKFDIAIGVRIIILVVNIAFMILFGDILHFSMNIDSMRINNPIIDIILVINGVVFLWNISCLIGKMRVKAMCKTICYFGKNTMGILIFHFIGFKVVTVIMCLFNLASVEMISLLCPPAELGFAWIAYTIVSITFSCAVWQILKKNKVISFLIGENKNIYKKIASKIENTVFGELIDVIEKCVSIRPEIFNSLVLDIKKEKRLVITLVIVVAFGVIYVLL